MHRTLAICALAGAVTLGAVVTPAQALPAQGMSTVPADHARGLSVIDKAGWRWRRVGWHRFWWRRWRRF